MRFTNRFATNEYFYMVLSGNQSEIRRHIKFVNKSFTNYNILIIKLIPSFCILDVGN